MPTLRPNAGTALGILLATEFLLLAFVLTTPAEVRRIQQAEPSLSYERTKTMLQAAAFTFALTTIAVGHKLGEYCPSSRAGEITVNLMFRNWGPKAMIGAVAGAMIAMTEEIGLAISGNEFLANTALLLLPFAILLGKAVGAAVESGECTSFFQSLGSTLPFQRLNTTHSNSASSETASVGDEEYRFSRTVREVESPEPESEV